MYSHTNNQPQPRSNHLTDATTNRDIFGVRRGACTNCNACGCFFLKTAKYTAKAGDGRPHPDNDLTITHCDRCHCPPDAHLILHHEHHKELGNDAFTLKQYDTAIIHYTKGLEFCNNADAVLWSNRSAAYAAKKWYEQALHDAERTISLKPEWVKGWSRKGAALMGLKRYKEAVAVYNQGLKVVVDGSGGGCGSSSDVSVLREGLKEAEKMLKRVEWELKRSSSTINSSKSIGGDKKQDIEDVKPAAVASQTTLAQQQAVVTEVPSSTGKQQLDVNSLWKQVQDQYTAVVASVAVLEQKMKQLQLAIEQQQQQQSVSTAHNADADNTINNNTSTTADGINIYTQEESEISERAECVSALLVHATTATVGFGEGGTGYTADDEKQQLPQRSIQQTICTDDNEEEEISSAVLIENQRAASQMSTYSDNTAASDGHIESLDIEHDADANTANDTLSPTLASVLTNATNTVNDENNSTDSTTFTPIISSTSSSSDHSAASSDNDDDSEEGGDTSSTSDDDDDYMYIVEMQIQEARKKLGINTTDGFIPPPTSTTTPHTSNNINNNTTTTASSTTTAGNASNRRRTQTFSTTAKGGGGGLGLLTLQSLCASTALPLSQTSTTNTTSSTAVCGPDGLPRIGCKVCGYEACGQYKVVFGDGDFATSHLGSVTCTTCGCDYSHHELHSEHHSRLQQEERQRQAALQRHHHQRRQKLDRIADAKDRQAAAEQECGEILMETDCDALTQARRGRCTAIDCCFNTNGSTGTTTSGGNATDSTQSNTSCCPGFRILYRTTDANNPEVMFYCSLCGCRAEDHEIDATWKAEEESRRRVAEQAAAYHQQQQYTQHNNRGRSSSSGSGGGGRGGQIARAQELEALQVLGLGMNADTKAITRAYKKLALKLHPDKIRQQPTTTVMENRCIPSSSLGVAKAVVSLERTSSSDEFVRVTEAYKLLTSLRSF